jgi:magnesium transporter
MSGLAVCQPQLHQILHSRRLYARAGAVAAQGSSLYSRIRFRVSESVEPPPAPRHVIVGEDATQVHFARETVERMLAEGRFFWLDLHQPEPDDFEVLRDVFAFHPLALEDSEHFEQRAKLDDYGDYVFLVVYGAAPDEDRLVEVHCFYSERYLVTIHRDDCPAFQQLRERYAKRPTPITNPALLLYRIVDGLVDSFFPILADFDDRIDELENQVFLRPDDRELQEIFSMKQLLVGLRKAITPQRDLFASLIGGVDQLPGMTEDDERYFRDVYDHLIRISELIDTYRDLLTSSMDVYLSTVSNRLNTVVKQLTIIATIFLPLTWVTGFFGQNFGFLVRHIATWQAFLGYGIALEIIALAILLGYFKRRGWF